MADEAYPIGPPPPSESYLAIDKLVRVAQGRRRRRRASRATDSSPRTPRSPRPAPRPGWSSSARPPQAIRALGDKTAARRIARELGVPTVPGTFEPVAGERGRARRGARDRLSADDQGRMGGRRQGHARRPYRERADRGTGLRAERGGLRVRRRRGLSRALPSEPRHIEVQVLADAQATSSTWVSASARSSAGTRSSSRNRRRRSWTRRCARSWARPACRIAKAAGLRQRGHGRVPGRRRAELLLPRDEHAAAGRAPGDRDGHRDRPGPRAAAHRGRRAAGLRAGRREPARGRDRVPDQRRGPVRRLDAVPGTIAGLRAATGAVGARRLRRLRGLHGAALL